MFDLKNGVISVFGIQISKNSVPEEIACLSDEIVSKKTSKYGHKHFKFRQPISASGVDMYLEVLFYAGNKVPQANLYPVIPASIMATDNEEIAKYCVTSSKRWLKHMIQDAPETEHVDGIFYDFGDGYIYAATQESRDYGLIGGEIRVRFEE